jgi:hypothetical protein
MTSAGLKNESQNPEKSHRGKTRSEIYLIVSRSFFGLCAFGMGIAALVGLPFPIGFCEFFTFQRAVVFGVFLVAESLFEWTSICFYRDQIDSINKVSVYRALGFYVSNLLYMLCSIVSFAMSILLHIETKVGSACIDGPFGLHYHRLTSATLAIFGISFLNTVIIGPIVMKKNWLFVYLNQKQNKKS